MSKIREGKDEEIHRLQQAMLDSQALHKKEIGQFTEEIKILRAKIEESERNQDLSIQRNSYEVTSFKLRITELENTIKDMEAARHRESTAHEERTLHLGKVPEGLDEYVKRIRDEFHLLVHNNTIIIKIPL
jgi:small-conductance mechanosensitive channel